jgi:hypothetical protein
MAGLWIHNPKTKEGKFLVVRRDGSIVDWPHFVLGARDPATPRALRAYAAEHAHLGSDPDFVADVYALANSFDEYRAIHGNSDPDAPPHRTDHPTIIEAMRQGGGYLVRLLSGLANSGDARP